MSVDRPDVWVIELRELEKSVNALEAGAAIFQQQSLEFIAKAHTRSRVQYIQLCPADTLESSAAKEKEEEEDDDDKSNHEGKGYRMMCSDYPNGEIAVGNKRKR
jgi:hypothetical protein